MLSRKYAYRIFALKTSSRILGGACLCTLVGILIAGLWPFTARRKNEVTRIQGSNGVRFRNHAEIVSSGTFSGSASQPEGACSLEMWFAPDDVNNDILAFYTLTNPYQFRIRQSDESLLLIRANKNQGGLHTFYMGVDHVVKPGQKLLATITSTGKETALYINGELAELSADFGLTRNDFTGELMVGNTPLDNSSWSGQLLGLAIYSHDLGRKEVLEHYHLWADGSHPEISETDEMVALYTLNEQSGQTIHNQANLAPNLSIPEFYDVRQHVILKPFWKEYHSGWSYYRDITINIVGFIPFGFVFCAFLTRTLQIRRAALLSVFLGLMLSLTIEILQAFIPT